MNQTKILLNTPTKTLLVNVADIILFKYDVTVKLWRVILNNGDNYTLRKKTSMEHILRASDDLFQVSLRVIVNLEYLDHLVDKDVVIKGFDEKITITRYFLDKLKERFYSL